MLFANMAELLKKWALLVHRYSTDKSLVVKKRQLPGIEQGIEPSTGQVHAH